jgi:D-alanyl-D-alanine-carboxypeptidase/D-alanyl-D-alanine-endopeptidase
MGWALIHRKDKPARTQTQERNIVDRCIVIIKPHGRPLAADAYGRQSLSATEGEQMQQLTRRGFSAGGIVTTLLVSRASALAAEVRAPPELPSNEDLRKLLAERLQLLSVGQDSIGMIAGVVSPRGRRNVSIGHRDKGDVRDITDDTEFEIGSVGKTFTALLLADMVVKHEVSFDDPVSKYLPKTVTLPRRNDRAITLLDLATHMSGLPFMPDMPSRPGGAAAYSAADVYAFLAHYNLSRDIGSDWDYSNLGYWLMGEALAARARKPFEALMRDRVLIPLGLTNTGFALSPKMKANLAIGHNASLQPAPALTEVPVYSLMPAAGCGFYSTTGDALAYLAAALGLIRSPLALAFDLAVRTRRPIPGSANVQALGWTIIGKGGDQLVFRDGGTLGFASCFAWDPTGRTGAVVLANCVSDVSDIAQHILRPAIPLKPPAPATHIEIPLDVDVLRRYVGQYEAKGEGKFIIALEGTYLTLEAPADWGLPKLRIRPESRENFFAAELPLRVTFQVGADGSATGMTIYPPRGQKGITAQKTG